MEIYKKREEVLLSMDLDVKRLIGCETPKSIDKYLVNLGSLKTDPANVSEVKSVKIKDSVDLLKK